MMFMGADYAAGVLVGAILGVLIGWQLRPALSSVCSGQDADLGPDV